jgi:hypothetical protein
VLAFVTFGEGNKEAAQRVGAMDGAALAREVDRYGGVFDDFEAVWNAPDAPEQLKAIERRLEAGEYGPLGTLLTPALTKAHASDAKAKEDRARVMEMLRN